MKENPAIRRAEDDVEETQLVARAQARDPEAFRLLVDRYRNVAYGLALRIVGSPEDAEEAAQEALVRAWLALPRFRGEARFSTWLHRIVARKAFDRLAVLRRRRAREVGVEAAETLPSASSGEYIGEGLQRSMRMESLISKLPDAQRAVLTLFYYEGRSVQDVATALEMPQGTVKTHLSRARAALRKAWVRSEGTMP